MNRRKKIYFWAILIGTGAVVLYFLDPLRWYMPKCTFKLLTGWSCPGCGFQRAVHALVHGRFLEAIHYNLFFAIGVPYLCAIIFANLVLKGEKQSRALAFLEGKFMVTSYVVLFCIWFVVRNIFKI